MSEAMRLKKQEEIEAFEKQEIEIIKEVHDDRCPCCGLLTSQLEFFNTALVQALGMVECTRCGNVYVPKSILNQKKILARSGLTPKVALQS